MFLTSNLADLSGPGGYGVAWDYCLENDIAMPSSDVVVLHSPRFGSLSISSTFSGSSGSYAGQDDWARSLHRYLLHRYFMAARSGHGFAYSYSQYRH